MRCYIIIISLFLFCLTVTSVNADCFDTPFNPAVTLVGPQCIGPTSLWADPTTNIVYVTCFYGFYGCSAGADYDCYNVIAINGCCYGIERSPDKGDYLKLCGQDFWQFISGSEDLYIDIIEPLGHQAKERNELFREEYAGVVNKFTREFVEIFCDANGYILWNKIIQFNSSSKHND